ncbi:hypothetical protein A8C56_12405 [Niabella ginsenosidivorans]|uniref:Glycoside hydrolase family 29 N-terminal domain-containing protein n=1 Tax=Niabella ginsenosidivorans TaxID=1176587 RepID=A0A1A9I1Z5_9BACT|nr:alpha-L-fucosidase [Niabella ginsenosidivorans]ANH81677.1 hypothetical protein A8C56_12405 [Niabella ginsenosidivorans]
MKKILYFSHLALLALKTKVQDVSTPTPVWVKETAEAKTQRVQWWTNARFGMYIYWGIYALPEGYEWVMSNEKISIADYHKYFERFNPDLYDPQE